MDEFLVPLLNLSVLVFAVASMLSVGFSYTFQEIIAPLRNWIGVVRTLIANFVLVPLLGFLVVQVIPLEPSLAIGLFLISAAAGAPFLIKLTAIAKQNVAFSATLLVLLVLATILYLPIVVPLALPQAETSAAAIAAPLVLSILLPLTAGLILRRKNPEWAQRWQPLLAEISSIALIILIVATFIVHFEGILDVLGEGAILAVLLVLGGAFAIGYFLAGTGKRKREELAFATAQRNVAAATVVATQTIELPGTIIMVVVSSLVGLAILIPAAFLIRRREQNNRTDSEGPHEEPDRLEHEQIDDENNTRHRNEQRRKA